MTIEATDPTTGNWIGKKVTVIGPRQYFDEFKGFWRSIGLEESRGASVPTASGVLFPKTGREHIVQSLLRAVAEGRLQIAEYKTPEWMRGKPVEIEQGLAREEWYPGVEIRREGERVLCQTVKGRDPSWWPAKSVRPRRTGGEE